MNTSEKQAVEKKFDRFWGYDMCNQFMFDEVKQFVLSERALAKKEIVAEILKKTCYKCEKVHEDGTATFSGEELVKVEDIIKLAREQGIME